MKTTSLDLRERLLAAYDADEGTREEVAWRFRVSLGLVKKLLQQRRRLGDLRPQHHRAGRKPRLLESHRQRLRRLVAEKPDRTLRELREALGLDCALPTIHYALVALGLTYKKKRCTPPSKTGPTSPGGGGAGGAGKAAGIPRGSSSSMKRRPKPI
jgi:transposase